MEALSAIGVVSPVLVTGGYLGMGYGGDVDDAKMQCSVCVGLRRVSAAPHQVDLVLVFRPDESPAFFFFRAQSQVQPF